MYSSLADIVKAGTAILSSSLLSSAETRRWLKPHSLLSDTRAAVGAPWEIYRVPLKPTNHVVDLYRKGGTFGSYNTELALIPDYNIGVGILTSHIGGSDSTLIADLVMRILLPALETAARAQAREAYAGRYRSQNPALNSSLVISADDNLPGMKIDSWISNGTRISLEDVLGFPAEDTSIRLYPTNLRSQSESGTQFAFRAVFENAGAPSYDRYIPTDCVTWFGQDSLVYGLNSLDELIFTKSGNGTVDSVRLPALRVTLDRISGG